MNFSDWIQSHRRMILFVLAVFGVAGLFSSFGLPVSLFPQVSFPRVVVSLDAGDRPAERMAVEVTWPVEEAIRAIPGVRSARSNTSRGSAEISINFDWGADMVSEMLMVESAISQISNDLPQGTTFEVRRMDPTVFPVLGYSLTSNTRSLVELRDLALYQIRPVLSTVRGVAKIGVLGGATSEYTVMVNLPKLDSFGLTLQDLANSLSAANIITAVGRLEQNDRLYLILSDTQFKNFDEIGRTILKSGENGLVELEDVATIVRGTVPQWTRVTADGHDAVLFQVYQQPGGNTVKIAHDAKQKLDEIRGRLPSDVKIANWYDQSHLIVSSAGSVRDAVIVGILLASIILFLFLRNVRITLIAVITVPVVLAATVLLLSLLKMSFNIMTLGGMAAAVGLVIDDSIVMIEHIIRRLRGGTGSYRERVMTAATEFTRPLTGSSASTIIIFAPLAFLSGVTGAFFKALSLTMASILMISFLVAWLAVPLLALHLLREKDTLQEEGGAITRAVNDRYARLMRRVLAKPALILVIVVPLLIAGWFTYRHTGSGFMPSMDEGGFILDYRAPAGTSLSETDRLLQQVEKILMATPEVETYSRRTGLQLGGGLTEANEGDYFIRLKPPPRRNVELVMDDVRSRVERSVPGLEVEMAQLMEDLIGDLTAVPQPIEIKLFSDDEKQLLETAPKVADAIRKIPGVVDVNDGIILAGDALDIRVDRRKAALEGVDPEKITEMVNGYLSGIVTTQIQSGPKMIGVRLWIARKDRSLYSDIEQLRLQAPDGHLFPLKRVAELKVITGQPQIMRDDLKRMVAVTGRISGRDMGSTIRDVKTSLSEAGLLPSGMYYALGGLYEQQRIAFKGLITVFVTAVVLVFALLLFLYESFRVSLAMLLVPLLAVAAVFIGLWITGTELNITAMMGMTMIIGIVTEVGVFYYSEYADLHEVADPFERLIQAGINRMRPIAMTTFAAILALMPLALGIGQGAAMQQPLAIAIISGLVVQLPLVLTLLPALLVLFGKAKPAIPTAA